MGTSGSKIVARKGQDVLLPTTNSTTVKEVGKSSNDLDGDNNLEKDELEKRIDEIASTSTLKPPITITKQGKNDDNTLSTNGSGNAKLSDRGLIGKNNGIDIDKILDDERASEFKFETETKETYIPYIVAKEKIRDATEEIQKIKDSSLFTLAQVEDNVLQFQEETKAKYELVVKAIQEKSLGCIQNYKNALEKTKNKYKAKENEFYTKEATLRMQLEKANKSYKELEYQLVTLSDRTEKEKIEQIAQIEKQQNEKFQEQEALRKKKLEEEIERLEAKQRMKQLEDDNSVETRQLVSKISKIARSDPELLPQYVLLVEKLSEWRGTLQKEYDGVENARIALESWEQGFKANAKRDPTDLDRPAHVIENETHIHDAQERIKELEAKVRQYEQEISLVLDQQGKSKTPVTRKKVDTEVKKAVKEEKNQDKVNQQASSTDNSEEPVEEAEEEKEEKEETKFDNAGSGGDENMPLESDQVIEETKQETSSDVKSNDAQHDKKEKERLESQLEEQRKLIQALKRKLEEVEAARETHVSSETKTETALENSSSKETVGTVERTTTTSTAQKEEEVEAEEAEEKQKEVEKGDSKTSNTSQNSNNEENKKLQGRIGELEKELKDMRKQLNEYKKQESASADKTPATKRYLEKIKTTEKKLKEAEKQLKEARNKGNRLEQQVKKLEQQGAANAGGSGNGKDGDSVKLRKELEDLKKKQKKQADEVEKAHQKQVRGLEKSLKELETESNVMKETLAKVTTELASYRDKVKKFDTMAEENEKLEEKCKNLDELKARAKELAKDKEEMEALYKEEQILRKKYWNMMEDMKGKIRVFCRARPMAKYELEKNCQQVVTFKDEFSLDIDTSKGVKQFVFDHVFPPNSTQAEIFEDTNNLIQSSLDGYNVCVFAYGQTGSGKTWTMVGSKDQPGIVRRSVTEIFKYKEESKGKNELVVRLYMMELYLDNLVDLLYKVAKKIDKSSVPADPPKLDIKKDKSGTVFVKGAQIVTVNTEAELLDYFEKANAVRKVASTKMNAGSSRSHLIFSVVLENTDLATKKTTVGKLSLVDLAGSERQEKTGATGEQLKEAMSINKSLSALGDVISALSDPNAAFIPYRNNKLTQLMSDSLGGNAKTLMFVNISPADYNCEETTSSLTYAARVKLITNKADKSEQNEELTQLKKIIKQLKDSGGKSELLDQLESGDI